MEEKLTNIFANDPSVKLAYLFGSQATGKTGPLSDYDIAIYLDEKNSKKVFDKKLEIREQVSRLLGTDRVDIVALDTVKEPEFAYNVIAFGKLVFEREPYKVLLEPKILNEYFDFRDAMRKFNLTKS